MNVLISAAIILLFCIDYYAIYNHTVKSNKNLTEKQKAHIISIKSTITLFLLSIYFNWKFVNSSCDLNTYLTSFDDSSSFVLELGIYNLMAYLIMDCVIGYLKYHKFMCTLSGYTHHIAYIFISILSFKLDMTKIYFLYMISELPTILLSIGQYNKRLRRDKSFGFTFFLTRIIYHMFLTYLFRENPFIVILGLLTLSLHIYWFKNWVTKWGMNIFIKNESEKPKPKTKIKTN
jgi:fumarate reductase subunit C